VINTHTGEFHAVDASALTEPIPSGHVLVQGTEEDVARVAKTVSAKYRAERKARNKAAKKSRRANR
jgi:hypothetical protein